MRRNWAAGGPSELPTLADLRQNFLEKHGASNGLAWSTARRLKAEYFLPADVYEATVAKHVDEGTAWLDVGGGHHIFPEHPRLARSLVSKCASVAAVDPDPTVLENDFVTERHQCLLEDFADGQRFDLATLRMLAEHVDQPARLVRALRALLRPDGKVIVLTVNRWSPVSILSRLVPFGLHHPIKRRFWGGDERDTFPVRYLMNTRATLRRLFEGAGFHESAFAYLDDLSTFGQFKWMGATELSLWSGLSRAGIVYPENCLLGIYRLSDAKLPGP